MLTDSLHFPQTGRLSANAAFTLTVDDEFTLEVLVPTDRTNGSMDDLVSDVNEGLYSAFVSSGRERIVEARRLGSRLSLVRTDGIAGSRQSLKVSHSNTVAQRELHLQDPSVLVDTFAQREIISFEALRENGQLSADVSFQLKIDNRYTLAVNLSTADTGSNTSLDDLASDLNQRLQVAFDALNLGSSSQLPARFVAYGYYLRLVRSPLTLSAANGVAVNQLHLPSVMNGSAVGNEFIGKSALPENGRLDPVQGDATFVLQVDGQYTLAVTVPHEDTRLNDSRADLIEDINAALSKAFTQLQLDSDPRITSLDRLSVRAELVAHNQALRLVRNLDGGESLVIAESNAAAQRDLHLQLPAPNSASREMLRELLPPEGDFLAIIIDALDGNDHIIVGPTVTKSVWVDAGAGDDRVEIVSGRPILIDQSEAQFDSRGQAVGADRNDTHRNCLRPDERSEDWQDSWKC